MVFEDIVYTTEQLMTMEVDTSMYQCYFEVGTIIATLDLKAKMNAPGRMRAFFTREDGKKIIVFLYSLNDYLGFHNIPVGSRLKLTFSETGKGIFLSEAQPMPAEQTMEQ